MAFSALYLHWRWTASLNPDALLFSIAVALAETLFFLGTLIFYFDIWDEGDTPRARPPTTRAEAALDQAPGAPITVDIFITTYDEDADVVRPSIADAQAVRVPPGHTVAIWLLDDGRRDSFRAIAKDSGVGYLTRPDNRGYKAGNLRNALFHTGGDFVVICDADTRLFPSFLENTLGYFQDPQVAWVQTPHWFYDIPEGRPWAETLAHATGLSPQSTALRWASAGLRAITGRPGSGSDPFLSEPGLFFDIIQRRRNRHGASFCCGAGSVHRREAVFHGALRQLGQDVAQVRKVCPAAPLGAVDLQPYRFHVSEDIYTSILLQSDPQKRWTSVYHPQVEARMLSPWTMQAWATQRLKYAGGTFDIMIHANPIWRRGMPWRTKLHYAATFWSYLACLWAPIMLVAPVLSLMTGMAPVRAYSLEFFAHFLPAILVSELAMVAAAKGHDIQAGRTMALGSLSIQLRALTQILRGQKARFPATPKTPVFGRAMQDLRFVWPNIALMGAMGAAAAFGLWGFHRGWEGYSVPFLCVNFFWLAWNGSALFRSITAVFWRPPFARTPTLNESPAHD